MRPQLTKNEGRLIAASVFMCMAVDTAYFVGFVGYAAYGLNGNASLIAFTMAVLSVFFMFGNLLGGIIVDRIGPRRTAIYSNIALIVLCIAAQFIGTNFTLFILLGSLFGLVGATQQCAFASFAPYLFRDREGIRRINSYKTTAGFLSTIVGSLLGAFIVSVFAKLHLFLFVAALALVSTAIVYFVYERYSPHEDDDDGTELAELTETAQTAETAKLTNLASTAPRKKPHPIRDALQGWHLIRGSASLRFYLFIAIAMWFSFGAFDALESIYYRDILHMPMAWVGWVNAIIGAGCALGAFALSRIPRKYIRAFLLVALLAFEGASTILYIATKEVLWSAIGAFILGIAYGIVDPLLRTLIQADSPLKAAGRVLGTVDMVRKGFTLIPLAIAPTLAGRFGVQPVLVGASVLTILLAAALYPTSRRLDTATTAGNPT